MGIIRQGEDSPYGSGLVRVGKKDSSLRLTVDYRNLNEYTVSEPFPIPSIEGSLRNLAKKQYFTCLDCKTAYHAFPLNE